MTKRNTRLSGALLLVLISLIGASLACYSDQLPGGMYELTPYYTPTPIEPSTDSRFGELQEVLAPLEEGRAFFNLTNDPEPLDDNLVNSKQMCAVPSSAKILFAGIGADGGTYYLVLCGGAVGWVADGRLAGPLLFSRDELAIAVGQVGATSVELLDPVTFKPAFNPLQQCKPETIVTVTDVQAEDPDGDGVKDIYYKIDCPTTGGPLSGLVTNADLFGPVKMAEDGQAIAVANEDGVFQLANEPAPVTEANAVEGECEPGMVLQASEAMLVDEHVYYNVSCGEIAGWVDQDNFNGPLKFASGDHVVIYVPPQYVFEDQLAVVQTEAVVVEGEEEGLAEVTDTTDTTATDETASETEGGTVLEIHERKVVEYIPPLYLTDKPEPVVAGEETNVVGQCSTNSVADLQEFGGVEAVYYHITCDLCVEETVDEDGITSCVYETQEGWAEQIYFQGPIDFVVGDRVAFKSSSMAIAPDEETQEVFSRIPASLSGASSVGRYTEYTGRCPVEEPLVVTGVVLDKARTSNNFTFFYRVQCTGEPATYQSVDQDGRVQQVVTYHADQVGTIEGFVAVRDVVAAE